jgi:hypothetical protein
LVGLPTAMLLQFSPTVVNAALSLGTPAPHAPAHSAASG